ncbi:MAG: DUF1573 domain-containing protein [Bacteroidales bacterium]|nr:DUF1573 domain-containing protein [Bacteroidales bacterium]
MKKIFCTLALLAFVVYSADAQRNRSARQAETPAPEVPVFVPQAEGPKIEFDRLVHDYGEIEQGADGDAVFTFRNIGSEPLILSSVRTGCGCAGAFWPREPIMPGETGTITIRYDTNRIGHIGRAGVVESNSVDNTHRMTLRITGRVVPRATAE